jgi:hypothetical protein
MEISGRLTTSLGTQHSSKVAWVELVVVLVARDLKMYFQIFSALFSGEVSKEEESVLVGERDGISNMILR